jgi:predicted TIM-barrel fold metal-dependent hydrolase
MKCIDVHTHVYSDDDVRYPTITNPTRPQGTSGNLATLKKLAGDNDVSRICVVQPSSCYGWDNRFVCDLALSEPSEIAVICTLNPEDSSSPALVGKMVKQYGIRGIRSIPTSDGHIDHPGVRNLWKACIDNDLTVNVFIKNDKAHELDRLLDEFQGIRCVIDHCLLLAAGQNEKDTLAAMLNLAQYPHTFAKLSFLTMGSAEAYPYSDLHISCRKIISAYTPSRCVWGSNFPCDLWTPRSTYSQNLHLYTSTLGLDTHAQEEIFWNTPSRLWFNGK